MQDSSANDIDLKEVFVFAGVEFDPGENTISFQGASAKLENKQFKFLLFLVQNPNKTIYKEEIHDAVWENTIVGDSSISRNAKFIRRAFIDIEAHHFKLIAQAKKGYRFAVDLEPESGKSSSKLLYKFIAIVVVISVITFSSLAMFSATSNFYSVSVIQNSVAQGVLSEGSVKFRSKTDDIVYLKYDSELSYYNSDTGSTTITSQKLGKAVDTNKVIFEGWVNDFLMYQDWIIVHKVESGQCLIEVIEVKNNNIVHQVLCVNDGANVALEILNDSSIVFSDGVENTNNLYNLDLTTFEIKQIFPLPEDTNNVYNIKVSPDQKLIAFLTTNSTHEIELLVGSTDGFSDYQRFKIAEVAPEIGWLNNKSIVYLGKSSNTINAVNIYEGSVQTIDITGYDLNGFFNINGDKLLFSHNVGEVTNYSLFRAEGENIREISLSSTVKNLKLAKSNIYHVNKIDNVENVWFKSATNNRVLTTYASANKILDYIAVEDDVLVSTLDGLDYWSQGVLKTTFDLSPEKLIEGSKLDSPYMLLDGSLLRHDAEEIKLVARRVASAYALYDRIIFTKIDTEGIFQILNDAEEQIYSEECGGRFSNLLWANHNKIYCRMQDNTLSTYRIDLQKKEHELINDGSILIDSNDKYSLVFVERESISRLGVVRFVE